MPNHDLLEMLDQRPVLQAAAGKIFGAACQETTSGEFLSEALPIARSACAVEWLALLRGEKAKWRTLAHSGNGTSGSAPSPPQELLSEAMDREAAVTRGQWSATPLDRGGA